MTPASPSVMETAAVAAMTCQMRYHAENCRASGHSRCRHQDRCVIIKRDGVNMPGAEAEAKAAAMDNAVDVWRLNTASRLHMACTWWEWKCSESNWQTIALDSDDRAVGHSYAIRGRMRLPVAPPERDRPAESLTKPAAYRGEPGTCRPAGARAGGGKVTVENQG